MADQADDSGINPDETKTEKATPSVVSFRSVLLFLISTVCCAVILEVIPTATQNLLASNFGNITLRRKYAIYGKSRTEDHLLHVIRVLHRLGLERTHLYGNWDLLWAHDYPFIQMPKMMKNLKPNQMVNHFPGCGFITNKVDLSTTPLPFLPKAFKLPTEKDKFLAYVSENPKALFVEKHNEHRFIEIKPANEIDLDSTNNFVQEYIQNPLLVDGHKFDIGVYVVITSVDPLRAYMYTGDVLFRFCPKSYYPFDPKDVNKYVVGDDYLPIWDVPSLSRIYNAFGTGMRGTFDAYLRHQGKNPLVIWAQVEDIIRRTIQAKANNIAELLKSYKTKKFFDLIRFDLIVDQNLNVTLMEANMSPNLSSAHFRLNSLLYEQILYSVLNLVGIGSPVENHILAEGSEDVNAMISSGKNVATLLNACIDFGCDKSCDHVGCELCIPCMSASQEAILHDAHREHLHRIEMKRLIPPPIDNWLHYDILRESQDMSRKDRWMARWFYAKCGDEITWCH